MPKRPPGGSSTEHSTVQNPRQHREMVEVMIGYLADGSIKPRVDWIIPFENFADAFELFEQNRGKGNTAICIKEEAPIPKRSKL